MMNLIIVAALLWVAKPILSEEGERVPFPPYPFNLASKVAALESKTAAQETRIATLEKSNRNLQNEIQALTNRRIISFLAVNTNHQSVPGNGAVKFSTVRHNSSPIGYGYDATTSHFRCPETGTYVFMFTTVTGHCSVYASFGIVKGEEVLSATQTILTSSTGNCWESLTASAVTPCRRGEEVYIKNLEAEARTVRSDSNGYTHFTGYKI